MDQSFSRTSPTVNTVLYVAFVIGMSLLLLVLPRQQAQWVLLGVVLVAWRIATVTPNLHRSLFKWHIPRLPISVHYFVELTLIVGVIVVSSTHILNLSPSVEIYGLEQSYLINSGAIAHETFIHSGAIPFWNPLLGTGEPLVEGAFSFILNPFMLIPMLFGGAVVGAKITIIIHFLLAGAGGWWFAYLLGLRFSGRVMLALLIALNGSLIGAIGDGQYQMGLSQVYMVWVYAGLWGVLYKRQRWHIGIFSLAVYLLVTAGTLWYVLPTVIGCGAIALCGVFTVNGRRLRFALHPFTRLVIAGGFAVGLSLMRVLPLWMNREHIWHPEGLNSIIINPPTTFIETFARFGQNTVDGIHVAVFYHYLIPPLFVVFIIGLFISFGWRGLIRLQAQWRIIIPTVSMTLLFTVWAQGGTPPIIWLYRQLPILAEWRILERMLPAAVPFLAVLIALTVDIIFTLTNRNLSTNVFRLAGFVAFMIVSGIALLDVAHNVRRVVITAPVDSRYRPILEALREEHPDGVLTVATADFFDYAPFYALRIRASLANPDYRIRATPRTIGSVLMFPPPDYAIVPNERFEERVIDEGFQRSSLSHSANDMVLYVHPERRPYTFIVPTYRAALPAVPTEDEYTPVISYDHRFDSIHIIAPAVPDDNLLVVHEIAYPGWSVSINGETAPLETIGTMLGVRIQGRSADDPPIEVIFRYRPIWFEWGASVSLLSIFMLIGYLLRVERWLPHWKKSLTDRITHGTNSG